jgi:DNA-binding transcriptional ArsR family regulator
MITMHLRAADLAETSFAISPLQETVLSLWVWQRPELQPFHLAWRQATLAQWRRADVELLGALVAPRTGWLPDFLTPRPTSPITEFAAELAAVAATPWRKVRADLEAAYHGAELPPVLRGRPSAVRARIVAALADYHRLCIEPSWPRMRAVLDGDIAYRSRRLADGGARELFGDLDARVHWDDGHLMLQQPGDAYHVEIDGRGLPLVPSLFAPGAFSYVSAAEPPVVVYPARGRAAVWETTAPPPAAALVELLGRSRAQLLTLLREPASTTELAQRLGVTPAAVSQHLAALHAGRLLTRTRSGRSVLYFRSELGDALAEAR